MAAILTGNPQVLSLNETTAARRRVFVYLTSGGVPVTGVVPSVRVSKNGTSAGATGSVTQIDSVNMAGHYYYEAAAGEVDTPGFLAIQMKDGSIDDFNTVVGIRELPEDVAADVLLDATQKIDGRLSKLIVAGSVSDADPAFDNFDTDLTEVTNDHYNKAIIVFTEGPNSGQPRVIQDYDGANKRIYVYPNLIDPPVNGDDFIILAVRTSKEDFADATWDEALADHLTAGTLGKTIDTVNTRVDKAVSAAESAIRGADSDTLKTISDQIDAQPASNASTLLNTVLDLTPTAGTVQEALVAALVDGLGKWVLDGTANELRLYDPSGGTLVATLHLGGPQGGPFISRERV